MFSIISLSIFALNKIDTTKSLKTRVIHLALKTKDNSAIFLPPTANISGSTNVCRNDPAPRVTFTGSNGNAPYTFTYTINGGTPNTTTSTFVPVSTSVAGTFVYELISVEDANNDVTTFTNRRVTITVGEPVVDFSFDNDGVCAGTNVNFTSTVTGNAPFTYNWSFGDGGSSARENPTHRFNLLGCNMQTANVTLTVTDANGCTNVVTKPVNVQQKPRLEFQDVDNRFDPFNNCGNNTTDPSYTINVDIENVSSCITSYDVDWGDGSSIETNVTFPATHTYTQLGSFNMDITGRGTNCDNTVTYLIKNSSNPTGSIVNPGNTVNLCTPVNPIEFAIGSWATNPPDTNYSIDYGDGNTENYTQTQLEASTYFDSANPAASQNYPIPHTYTESSCPNSYTVILAITTSCGQTNLTAGPIIILRKPEVSFEDPPTSCVNTPVSFNNTSLDGYSNNCSVNDGYYWDFGDGNTSTTRNPSHTYTSAGTYTVSLYAENSCGVTNTVSKTICIEPQLTAAFTVDANNGCSPLAVQTTNATDLSLSCGTETYLWEVTYTSEFCGTVPGQWNFTGSTDQTSASPSINFITAGSYELQLTTTNSCGTSIATQTIEVKQPPTATIDAIPDFCGTASITPVATINSCAPASETITYSWTFPGGTPATASTLDPGTITYASPGDYQISFSITNNCGTITDTEDFSVNPIPSVTNTNLSQTICSGTDTATVNLTSNIANTSFSWTTNAPSGITGHTSSGTTNVIPAQTIFNSNTTSEDVIYTITPSVGGCAGSSVSLIITVDPAPAFTSQPQPETICLNGPVNTLSVAVNGPGTSSYQWYSNTSNSSTGGTAIASETNATYTPPNNNVGIMYYYNVVSFTSGAGCNEITSNVAQIEVVNGIQIDTQPINTQSICNGGNITSPLTVMHSGGTGSVTYQWYTNTTNSNTGGSIISGATGVDYTPPMFSTSGNFYYYVTISLTGSGCSAVTSNVAQVVVTEDPTITTQPLNSQTLCQNVTPTNLEVAVSGGLGSTYNYQWYSNTSNSNIGGSLISGATNNTYTPPTNTVGTLYYYAEVTQPDPGCGVTSSTAEVIVNPAPNFTTQPISNTYCLGDNLNTLSVSYSNGVGSPAYQWYSNTINDASTGTPISGATTSTYTPPSTSTGTIYYYTIITFSAGGCTEITSDVAEITINQTPRVSDKSDIICSGTAFNISPDFAGGDIAPSGTFYTWPTPSVSPSGTITGASSQTTNETTISQTLTNTTTSPATVTYVVTPTIASCTGNPFTVTITVNPSISIVENTVNSNCYSANNGSIDITISGGVPFSSGSPYQVSWSGPNGYTNNTEDISSLAPGNYTVNIQDDGGCPFTKTFNITEPDELIFSAIDFNPETISCFNVNDGEIGITVSGGTTPYQYNWTKNGLPYATTEDLSNLDEGIYEITVTDANSCTPITQTFNIIEPDLLDVSLNNQVNVICYGEATGEIYINTNGGRPTETSPGNFDYSYAWTGPNGYTNSTQNITGLIAGTYNVTVTDKSNCTDTLEVILTETNEILIDYTATEIECYGDNDASITINNISGGNAPYTITWSNLGSGVSQTNLSPGDYTITVTDNTNCPKSVTVTIEEPPIFDITPTTNNVSCFGANDGRIVLNLVGGINPVSLVWDDDATAGVERNNIGPGSYTVTITDGTPCEITETFVIAEPAALALSANTTDALNCDNANSGAINLIVTGGTLPLSYLWSNGETTENLSAIPPGNYSVVVTDANNCEITGSWNINRFEPLVVNVDTLTDFDCETKTVNQTFEAKPEGGVPPYNISWSNGTVSGANGEFMNTSQNGFVIIEVEDSMGCTTNYSYNVDITTLGDPGFNISSSTYNNFGFYSIHDPIQFTNTATGSYTNVSWNFGDGHFSIEENPVHTYTNEGNYTVEQTVTYPFGCVYTMQILLIVEKGYRIIIPNAFTPNGDNMNEYFVPESIALSELSFNIYNTWGGLIYSEEGETIKGWDGKIKDNQTENGNYYYTFSGKTFYGETITRKGAFVSIK
ncbi:hypothetical protein GCM10022291_07540 [Postechiella marina]|uniref:PKD domain-containing protein n=1 Tax=Postechiella marina TaxID=943941 RepID=A0ABP8C2M3_9FLAO